MFLSFSKLLDEINAFALISTIDKKLEEFIKETCRNIQVDIIEMEIMPDHVHLLIEVAPQFGVHKAIKKIK